MATKVSWIKADIQIRLHLEFIAGVKDAAKFEGASPTSPHRSTGRSGYELNSLS